MLKWLDFFQLLLGGAGVFLLWTLRSAFWSGQFTADYAKRFKDLEDGFETFKKSEIIERLRRVEDMLSRLEKSVQEARDKQSEVGSEVTSKIGEVEMDLRELKTELKMAQAEAARNHTRFDREITGLWDELRRTHLPKRSSRE